MNWEHLKFFLAIAETSSLSGAANQLNVNHSTVFRRLKALEDEIEGRLFDRIDHRYVLTATGETLLAQGQQIAAQFDKIDRLILGHDKSLKGTVRITAPFNLATRYLPKIIAEFKADYPNVQIEILSSNQEINMNNRIADIAVRVSPSPPEHLVGRKVLEIPWGVFASAPYIQQHKEEITINNLSQHALIGGTGHIRNLAGFKWLDKTHSDQIHLRSDELSAMAYLAEEGLGLAFLPLDQMRKPLINVCSFPYGKTSDLWILTHPDLRKTTRIQKLMSHLAEQFASLNFIEEDCILPPTQPN